MQTDEFIKLKKAILEKQFGNLNEQQRQAVFQVESPVLILAGAGSGKTTVIVNRIAYLLQYGNAYHSQENANLTEDDITFLRSTLSGKENDPQRLKELLADNPPKPWNVLAITFTNKAANELKDRLKSMLGNTADLIHAGTFHSQCVRILRRYIHLLGYASNFSIYDSDDSKRIVKQLMKEYNLNEKMFSPRDIAGEISRAKDGMISSSEYQSQNQGDFRKELIGKVYEAYQKYLRSCDALDFDDIIYLTVKLLSSNEEVLESCRREFQYILVDEYQDTNHAQYQLIRLLSGGHKRLCVVGDDDQSIYRFRGATIENILQFEKQFPQTVVIRLEQNYRSTQNILTAANHLIQNNRGRKGKNLWTNIGDGQPITVCRVLNDEKEAIYIKDEILKRVENGGHYKDHAILYRMNSQSASLERCFIRSGIPYRIIGGIRFYDRKEIRDILAYLQVINRSHDNLRLGRIINQPKRGIGDATVEKVQAHANEEGKSFYEVISNASSYPDLASKADALLAFVKMIEELRTVPLNELIQAILDKTGYLEMLKDMGTPGETDLENIMELQGTLKQFLDENPETDLSNFLEEIALYTDLDSYQEDKDYVVLMTLHAAKGLEFPVVFLTGVENGILPNLKKTLSDVEIEEERRLTYVGITRAKEKLYLSNAKYRSLFGDFRRSEPSCFLSELPPEVLQMEDQTKQDLDSFRSKQTTHKITLDSAPKKAPEPATIDYTEGDRIRHAVFGDGEVLSMTKMGNDFLVEVNFDKRGRKKIMANFARLTKV